MTPRPEDWMSAENMRRLAANGRGVYWAYDAYEQGTDRNHVRGHGIVDDDYAHLYARNIVTHLGRLGVGLSGDFLDAGCGLGAVTAAFAAILGEETRMSGIDLSESAIRVAGRTYPTCRFEVHSADDLSIFEDASLHLIHAREFYPFTRTADIAVQIPFLRAFAAKLAPGGAVAAVQIVERTGLADTIGELRRRRKELGYSAVSRHVVVPRKLYERWGDRAHWRPVYAAVALAGAVLERLRPGLVSYLYLFRKGCLTENRDKDASPRFDGQFARLHGRRNT